MEDNINQSKNYEETLSGLEALLFIHGEPLGFDKIAKILNTGREDVVESLKELEKRLDSSERGLGLVIVGDKAQLVTKSKFGKILEGFMKEELSEELTPASLETLSIISYMGPVSRMKIEYLRGVNSTFTIRSLLMRGLIDRSPNPEQANSFVYEPSVELIKHLGLKRKEELPEYEKFKSLLEAPGASASAEQI